MLAGLVMRYKQKLHLLHQTGPHGVIGLQLQKRRFLPFRILFFIDEHSLPALPPPDAETPHIVFQSVHLFPPKPGQSGAQIMKNRLKTKVL